MLRRTTRSTLPVLFAAVMTAATVGSAVGSQSPSSGSEHLYATASPAPAGSNAGPPYDYVTVLNGQFTLIPLKDQAMLTKTTHGYRFRTGQQDSHLVVTLVKGGLRIVDTGTKTFKTLSPTCHRRTVETGIAAVCDVPSTISVREPLLLEVWPRLGNDFTDTSTLPATFAVTVLADDGNDVAYLGAGPDFFNGADNDDIVQGGGSNDWIRGGAGNDAVQGDAGNDYLVAQEGSDSVRGGDGDDRVDAGDNDDRLWGDAGADFLLCGTGGDTANSDAADRIFHDCETINSR